MGTDEDVIGASILIVKSVAIMSASLPVVGMASSSIRTEFYADYALFGFCLAGSMCGCVASLALWPPDEGSPYFFRRVMAKILASFLCGIAITPAFLENASIINERLGQLRFTAATVVFVAFLFSMLTTRVLHAILPFLERRYGIRKSKDDC